MSASNSQIEEIFSNLPDEKLVEMLEVKSDDYTQEALQVAKNEADKRGGIKIIKETLERERKLEAKERLKHEEKDNIQTAHEIDPSKKKEVPKRRIANKTIKIRNKVERVKLAGGIIGLLGTSPRRALSSKIEEFNQQGWHVRQVINDETGNLLIWIGRFIILLLTLFLWTPANGYFVIFERDDG